MEAGLLAPSKASMLNASKFAEESETIAATSDVAIVPALINESSAMDIAGVESEHTILEFESNIEKILKSMQVSFMFTMLSQNC